MKVTRGYKQLILLNLGVPICAFSVLNCGTKHATPVGSTSGVPQPVTDTTEQEFRMSFKPPVSSASNVVFEDTSEEGGVLSGLVRIARALDERSLTHYVLYWGTSSETKFPNSLPLATISKTFADLSTASTGQEQKNLRSLGLTTSSAILPEIVYEMPKRTLRPPGATHILVFTKNANGEMSSGVSTSIEDKTAPLNSAQGIGFEDTDLIGGRLGGNITVIKAASESDITAYVLYWGSEPSKKLHSLPFATIEKTGSNLRYEFPTGTIKPEGADYILVFTRNAQGERGKGTHALVTDKGVPISSALGVSFTDTDPASGKVGGSVQILRSPHESNISHYVVYWGTSPDTKLDPTPIATLAKTSENLIYELPQGTIKPTSATHLIVFTKNSDGEMQRGIPAEITDVFNP